MLTSKEYMKRLEERSKTPEAKLSRLKEMLNIVYCNSCSTYSNDLNGQREPDFEGYCPKCGDGYNWDVVSILDYKDRIIELLNEHGE